MGTCKKILVKDLDAQDTFPPGSIIPVAGIAVHEKQPRYCREAARYKTIHTQLTNP